MLNRIFLILLGYKTYPKERSKYYQDYTKCQLATAGTETLYTRFDQTEKGIIITDLNKKNLDKRVKAVKNKILKETSNFLRANFTSLIENIYGGWTQFSDYRVETERFKNFYILLKKASKEGNINKDVFFTYDLYRVIFKIYQECVDKISKFENTLPVYEQYFKYIEYFIYLIFLCNNAKVAEEVKKDIEGKAIQKLGPKPVAKEKKSAESKTKQKKKETPKTAEQEKAKEKQKPTTASKTQVLDETNGIPSLKETIQNYENTNKQMAEYLNSEALGFQFGEVDATSGPLFDHRQCVETIQKIFNDVFVSYLKILGLYTLQILAVKGDARKTLTEEQLKTIEELKTKSNELISQVEKLNKTIVVSIKNPNGFIENLKKQLADTTKDRKYIEDKINKFE